MMFKVLVVCSCDDLFHVLLCRKALGRGWWRHLWRWFLTTRTIGFLWATPLWSVWVWFLREGVVPAVVFFGYVRVANARLFWLTCWFFWHVETVTVETRRFCVLTFSTYIVKTWRFRVPYSEVFLSLEDEIVRPSVRPPTLWAQEIVGVKQGGGGGGGAYKVLW